MLAWSEELTPTSWNQKSWLWRHCGRRAIYRLLRSPSQTCHAKPKLKSTGAGRYQLLSRWWDAYRKQLGLKDFSPKSQDAVALQQIKERGALPMIDRGDIRQAIDRCSNIWASLPGAGYVVSSSIRLTAWLQNLKEAGERSERSMYEQSSPRLSPLWLSASSSACHGLLIITVITPLPTKPSATKMPEKSKLANAAITDMQMSAWCCCARCKIHEGVSWIKLKMYAWCDDVAVSRRRLHIKAVCQSVREATTASGVDNAASPDWQTPLNGIISPSERGWSLCKTTEGTQKYINEQCR